MALGPIFCVARSLRLDLSILVARRLENRPKSSTPVCLPNTERPLRQKLRRLVQRTGCSTIRMFIASRLNRPVVDDPSTAIRTTQRLHENRFPRAMYDSDMAASLVP
jgi:hypothetical protein